MLTTRNRAVLATLIVSGVLFYIRPRLHQPVVNTLRQLGI